MNLKPGTIYDYISSALGRRAKHDVMQRFTDLSSLDNYLVRLDAAAQVSDDQLRALFDSFEWQREPCTEQDPYSVRYKEQQMQVYCTLAGVTRYDTANERSHFDVAQAVRQPFPYHTGSPQTVGDHLMGIGFLIKTAGIMPGAKVLEFGPGWGNTTLAFVQLGYQVTALDIEPNFVDLVRRRVEATGLEVEAIEGDFSFFYDTDRKFDAVVFFECFHHCNDHLKLLQSLRRMLTPDGVVVFAAEPITDSFPVPWGVRLDGQSVWSIRKYRWLELGFQESYFVRTMMRVGWIVTRHFTDAASFGTVFLARPFRGAYQMGTFFLPPDEDATWAIAESDPTMKCRYTSGKSEMTLDDDPTWVRVSLEVFNNAPYPLEVQVDGGAQRVVQKLKSGQSSSLNIPLGEAPRKIRFRCPVWSPAKEGLNSDTRMLGIGVRQIQLHPADAEG